MGFVLYPALSRVKKKRQNTLQGASPISASASDNKYTQIQSILLPNSPMELLYKSYLPNLSVTELFVNHWNWPTYEHDRERKNIAAIHALLQQKYIYAVVPQGALVSKNLKIPLRLLQCKIQLIQNSTCENPWQILFDHVTNFSKCILHFFS